LPANRGSAGVAPPAEPRYFREERAGAAASRLSRTNTVRFQPVLALSTGQELGLALVAAVFIAFALASSFLLPRRNPDFPTERGLRRFVVASVVLFVAMMAAVLIFAREDEEAEGAPEEGPAETRTTTEPEVAPEGEPAQGDAEAGAAVFESAGCGGCHTLEAAGTRGTVGPNLDESKPPHSLVVDRVTNGQGAMPSFKDRLDEKQIQDVAAYVVASTGGE
jgi:mono/diheme cytochrome c family protein